MPDPLNTEVSRMLNMLDARKKGLAHEETSMLPAGKTIEPVMGSAKKTLKDFGNKGLPVAKVSQVRSYSRVEGDESNSEKTNLTGSQNLQRKSIDQRSRLELATLASRNERRPSGQTIMGRFEAVNLIKSLETLNRGAPIGDNLDKRPLPEVGNTLEYLPLQINIDSDIEEFRKFTASIVHPARVLDIIGDDSNINDYDHEFGRLCLEVMGTLSDFESSVEEFLAWKDDFLKQRVPSSTKLTLTLLISKLFRCKSDLHEPLFHLIRSVRIYSAPWTLKSDAILSLERDQRKVLQVLDIAVRKMEQLQAEGRNIKGRRAVGMWERFTTKTMAQYYGIDLNGSDFGVVEAEAAKFRLSGTRPTTIDANRLASLTPKRIGVEKEVQTEFVEMDNSTSTANAQSRTKTPDTDSSSIAKVKPTSRHQSFKAKVQMMIEPLEAEDEDMKEVAERMARFTAVVRHHHPHLKLSLKRVWNRPFPTRIPTVYPSMAQHSFVIPPRPRKFIARSISLIHLPSFTHAQQPNLFRCNSFDALMFLSKAMIRNPLPEMETMDIEEVQRIPRDERLAIEHMIQTVMADSGAMKPASGEEDNQEGPAEELRHANADHKTKFTLIEVMELTLLHASQLQLLKTNYEDQIESVNIKMDDMDLKNSQYLQELQEKLDHEKSRNDALEQEIENMKEVTMSASYSRRDHFSADKSRMTPRIPPKSEDSKSRKTLPKQLKFSNKKLKASFLDRLAMYTEERLQNLDFLQKKVTSEEIKANELRLFSQYLLKDDAFPESLHELQADFMPLPQLPRHPNHLDMLESKGVTLPWGGRFNIRMNKENSRSKENLNILNLFDVARLLEKRSEKTEEP